MRPPGTLCGHMAPHSPLHPRQEVLPGLGLPSYPIRCGTSRASWEAPSEAAGQQAAPLRRPRGSFSIFELRLRPPRARASDSQGDGRDVESRACNGHRLSGGTQRLLPVTLAGLAFFLNHNPQ